MSHALIARSPDLTRLRNEGYGVTVVAGAVVVEPVPFLDENGTVRTGALISDLDLSADRATKPSSHVVYFAGGTPHDRDGRRLDALINGDVREQRGGHTTSHMLSSKPGPAGYPDYHAKMSTYVNAIAAHAQAVDDNATPRCFPPQTASPDDGPFLYLDTASARVGVDTTVFNGQSVAIIGLGGTGVYVLDLVAKTPVDETHLFDGDILLQHNAFRAPGPVTLEQLRDAPKKVEHWATVYSQFRRGIVPHPYRVDEDNVGELDEMDFVFVCVDDNDARELITRYLTGRGIPFIDTGMGLYRTDDGRLGGTVRTTTATPGKHDHLDGRLPRGMPDADAEYTTNIQIVELNALNATLAVIRWKKTLGFYADLENEHQSSYVLSGNNLLNEDPA